MEIILLLIVILTFIFNLIKYKKISIINFILIMAITLMTYVNVNSSLIRYNNPYNGSSFSILSLFIVIVSVICMIKFRKNIKTSTVILFLLILIMRFIISFATESVYGELSPGAIIKFDFEWYALRLVMLLVQTNLFIMLLAGLLDKKENK